MKNIRLAGVVGAGTMGSAIAQKFAQEGLKVILADRTIDLVNKGIVRISDMLQEGVQKNVLSTDQREEILASIEGTDNLEDLKLCDLVIEAICEHFQAKTQLVRNLRTS